MRELLSWAWCILVHQRHHVEVGAGAFHCRRCNRPYPGDADWRAGVSDLDEMVTDFKAEHGFGDEAWTLYSDLQRRVSDVEDEASRLRDIARRAAVLVRWFSREDVPFVVLTDQERAALNTDAEALGVALERYGYYPEGWGS